jgi:hypothetical protein
LTLFEVGHQRVCCRTLDSDVPREKRGAIAGASDV